MHQKLDEIGSRLQLQCHLQEEHLFFQSSKTQLSGHKTHFLFGVITEIKPKYIGAVPIVISTMTPPYSDTSYIGQNWTSRLEIFIDSIDSFKRVRTIKLPSKQKLNILKNISEFQIKKAICEIIGEQNLDKDWGGERSDIFTTMVQYKGRRISTAMVLKGPSKFKPMTLASLGKNGDQIDRLFTEPAELFILQHCHIIKKEVRGTMRAYANQINNLRLFCLINGYDTWRLLKAYKKCGL